MSDIIKDLTEGKLSVDDAISATMTEARVETGPYEFAHGKKPSGHGSWFFSKHRGGVDFSSHKDGEDHIQISAPYGEAKAKALKWAGEKGHNVIYACS
jgi:hypothetical protein